MLTRTALLALVSLSFLVLRPDQLFAQSDQLDQAAPLKNSLKFAPVGLLLNKLEFGYERHLFQNLSVDVRAGAIFRITGIRDYDEIQLGPTNAGYLVGFGPKWQITPNRIPGQERVSLVSGMYSKFEFTYAKFSELEEYSSGSAGSGSGGSLSSTRIIDYKSYSINVIVGKQIDFKPFFLDLYFGMGLGETFRWRTDAFGSYFGTLATEGAYSYSHLYSGSSPITNMAGFRVGKRF